jgi:hypothetical protein
VLEVELPAKAVGGSTNSVRDSLSLSSSSASSSNTALTGSSSTPAANNANNNDETASTSSGSSSAVDVASIDVMRRLDEVSLLNFILLFLNLLKYNFCWLLQHMAWIRRVVTVAVRTCVRSKATSSMLLRSGKF